MSDDIRPALTPEEWAQQPTMEDTIQADFGWSLEYQLGPRADVTHNDRHAMAALALYGQPFGFTPEDVEVLNGLLVVLGRVTEPGASAFYVPRISGLRDRIAALLPQENAGATPDSALD